jgi:hypothetical protein
MEPKSLAQWSECVGAESRCFRILRECLGVILHAPRGLFYSPKAARSRWRSTWKAILAFCRVAHRTSPVDCPVRDLLPNLAYLTIAPLVWLAHQTLSGAHWTVRCTNWSLEQSTCHAKIAWPPVAQATVDSPDSPVHHQTVRWILAVRRRRIPRAASSPRTSLAHRALSGAPPDSPVCQTDLKLGCIEPIPSLFLSSSLVTCF